MDIAAEQKVSRDELSDLAVATYGYLRNGMVVVLVALLVSVVVARLQASPGVGWLPSISDYYYSPARAIFVSVLVALGACLVILKGNTTLEDTLLNIAGMLAPVVALVPKKCVEECSIYSDATGQAIGNNVGTLIVTGILGIAVVITLYLRGKSAERPGRRGTLIGIAAVTVVWAAYAGWFAIARTSFRLAAHFGAAVPMFVIVVVVVIVNAIGMGRHDRGAVASLAGRAVYLNRYTTIAVMLTLGTAALAGVWWLIDREHLTLVVEAWVLVWFALFWVAQGAELRDTGLRGAEPRR